MNPLALEWIEKAEEDLTVAQREMRARISPGFGAICFHAQQCAEKYFKARLQAEERSFPRTHNLVVLLNELARIDGTLNVLYPAATLLVDYAVRYRYPGAHASRDDARAALNHAKLVRDIIRSALGLPIETKTGKRPAAIRRRKAVKARRRRPK